MSGEPSPANDSLRESRSDNLSADRVDPICDRFEAAWRSGQEPRIEDFLDALHGDTAAQRQLLIELIRVDLHWRGQRALRERAAAVQATEALDAGGATPASGPAASQLLRLEDYLTRFPLLGPADGLPVHLIAAEYRARQQAGEHPGRAEYEQRFLRQREVLAEALAGVDAAIARAAPNAATAPAVGTRVRYFGDYELLEEIARGGMGVVYRARQRSLNRVVALKMILSGDFAGEDEVRRFHAEAEAAAGLDHPGIVPIFEVGVYEGRHFFSMGYVAGESLARRIARGPIELREAAELVRRVAQAVEYAHQKGIIHRDLKPGNIILDENGSPRVTDFGLAKRVDAGSELTATGQVLGTPSYMPPEQAAGRLTDIGPASDVYALGAVLYALLTGRPPFQAASLAETLRQVMGEEPVSPSLLNPHIPADLATICLKCLEKEPARRYASARELADDVERWLDGRPIRARPATAIERTQKWVRRNRTTAALLVVVAASLLLGTTVSLLLAVQARHNAAEANRYAVKSDRNASLAQQEKARAQGSEKAARQLAYAATVNAAYEAHRQGQNHQAVEQLALLIPDSGETDLREFAWHYLWRVCHGELPALPSSHDSVFAVQFSPDASYVASAHGGGVRLWSPSGGPLIREFSGERGAVTALAVAPDGDTVATGEADRAVRLWSARTGRLLGELGRHAAPIHVAAFSPDNKWLAVAGGDMFLAGPIAVWNLASRKCETELAYDGRSSPQQAWGVGGLSFSKDGRLLTAAAMSGKFHVWRVGTWESLAEKPATASRCTDIAFSPNGKLLATSHVDRTLRLWNTETFAPVDVYRTMLSPSWEIEFTPDGAHLGFTTSSGVALWDPTTRQSTSQGANITDAIIAFHPQGRSLVAANMWGEIRQLPLRDHLQRAVRTTEGGPVYKVAHLAGGRVFSIQPHRWTLWDLSTGEAVQACRREAATSEYVDVHPAGHSVAEVDAKKKCVRIHESSSGNAGKALPGQTFARYSGDGRLLATAAPDDPNVLLLYPTQGDSPPRRLTGNRSAILWATFADQAQTLFTLADNQEIMQFHLDRGTAERVGRMTEVGAVPVMWNPANHLVASRDGLWLAVRSVSPDKMEAGESVQLWDVREKKVRAELSLHESWINEMLFAPDGNTLVTCGSDGRIGLCDVRAGRLAGILSGHAGQATCCSFNPAGTILVTGGRQTASGPENGDLLTWIDGRASPAELEQAEQRRRTPLAIRQAFTRLSRSLAAGDSQGIGPNPAIDECFDTCRREFPKTRAPLSDLRLIYHLAAAQGVGMDQSASSPAFEHLLRRELETFEEVSAPYPASSPMHVFTALAAISLARRSDAKAEQERYWSRASEKLLAVMQSQGWSPQKVVMDYPQMLGEATQRHLAAAASLGHHEAALNLGERVLAVHRMSAAGWMRSLGWSEALARVCPEGPAAKGRTSRDGPTTADRYRSLAMDFLELSTQQLSRSEAHSWQDFDGLLAKTASGLKRRWPQEVAAVRAKAAGAKP